MNQMKTNMHTTTFTGTVRYPGKKMNTLEGSIRRKLNPISQTRHRSRCELDIKECSNENRSNSRKSAAQIKLATISEAPLHVHKGRVKRVGLLDSRMKNCSMT